MVNYIRACILALVVLCLSSCGNEEAKEIPISTFFKSPEKSEFKISPDGKYVSYFKAYQDRQNIFIQSLTDGKETQVTSFSDFPVSDYIWTGSGKIVFTRELTSLNEFKIYSLDASNQEIKSLLTLNSVQSTVLNSNYQVPDEVIISLNKKDFALYDLYQLDIKTGSFRLLLKNPGNITKWLVDNYSDRIIAKASDGINETLFYQSDDNELKPFLVNNFKNVVNPIGFSSNPNVFYALSNVDRDKMALVAIDMHTGSQKVLVSNATADITDVNYSNKNKIVEAVNWDAEKPQYFALDSAFQVKYKRLLTLLPGMQIDIIDRDKDEQKLLLKTYTDRDPGAYYVYQITGERLYKLADSNADIDPDELCDMQPIVFQATDSLLINGYLTLPKGALAVNLPLVVIPHTNLWQRDLWEYNPEVQFLANRGYAVLQVNYRGSKGYGKKFHLAGFQQVGGKVQQDIADGVKWLIEKKIVDPKRIGIYGTAIGGFSALYGVCFHPDLFSCASIQSGVINFFSYIKDAPVNYKPYLSMIYEMVGNPQTDAEEFRAFSPVFHANRIKTPLLIFQGAKDPRVNIMELNQFVNELRKNNVNVKYILKENERAVFNNERNKFELYQELEEFLNTNLMERQ